MVSPRGGGSGVVSTLSAGLRTLSASPRTLVVGFVLALAQVAVATLLPRIWRVTGDLTTRILVQTGQTWTGTLGGVMASEVTVLAVKVVVFLVPVSVLFGIVWTVVGTPGLAHLTRVVRGRDDGSVPRELPDALATALLRRLLAVGTFVVLLPALLGVYFGVGTLLEAVGYALGAYEVAPLVVPLGALLLAVVFSWGATVAAFGFADVARREGDSPMEAVRASLEYAVRTPRSAFVHGAVAFQLVIAPVVAAAGVGGVVAGATGEVGTAATVAASLAFLSFGTVGFALSMTYRVLAFDREAPQSGASRMRLGGRVPTGRVVLVALVVSAAFVGGGFARVADVRPVDSAPPGPVSAGDDPQDAVAESLDALRTTDHETDLYYRSRPVYPDNGTAGEWEAAGVVSYRIQYTEREMTYSVTLDPEGRSSTLYYVTGTAIATGDLENVGATNVTAEDVSRAREWEVHSKFPGQVTPGGVATFGAPLGTRKAGTGWSFAERSGDRVVVVRERTSTVESFSFINSQYIRNGTVRVRLDADTGHVQRVEVAYTQVLPGEYCKERACTIQSRAVWDVRDHGSTDVSRPPSARRRPVELLLDALFY